MTVSIWSEVTPLVFGVMVKTDVEGAGAGAGAAEDGGSADDVGGGEASLETVVDSTDDVGCSVTVDSGKEVMEVATMEANALS